MGKQLENQIVARHIQIRSAKNPRGELHVVFRFTEVEGVPGMKDFSFVVPADQAKDIAKSIRIAADPDNRELFMELMEQE